MLDLWYNEATSKTSVHQVLSTLVHALGRSSVKDERLMADFTTDTNLKRCSKCGIEKPATPEFFHRQTTRRGLPGLRPDCKDCIHIKSQEWHLRHVEEHREKSKRYNQEHRIKATERERRWRENNPEAARARSRRYYKAHAEERKSITRLKRAQLRNIPGIFTEEEVTCLYQKQHGKCYYCGVSLKSGYHRDHVVPLSRGGRNDISNIVLACPQCNWSKNDRLPHEWPKGGRLL